MKVDRRKVVLAGAGPGDPELISLKALKAIETADVILYDALVNPELLIHAKQNCKVVFVGKRKGCHSHSQNEINDELVSFARKYENVLRLKGGDPFVFGRGYEEIEHLKYNGFDVEVIPGISSATAAPMAAGIPVTLRHVSESFWVVTGMTASNKISSDVALAAQSSGTVVILMGLSKLEEIMTLFSNSRSPEEPVAIIENAYTNRQRVVVGTAASINGIAKENSISTPAVIIVGEVVRKANPAEFIQEEDVKLKVAV